MDVDGKTRGKAAEMNGEERRASIALLPCSSHFSPRRNCLIRQDAYSDIS